MDEKALEEAIECFNNLFDMGANESTAIESAIARYLEVSGVGRDAERYREWRRAFREGECGLYNALCEAHSDAEHDSAIDTAMQGG